MRKKVISVCLTLISTVILLGMMLSVTVLAWEGPSLPVYYDYSWSSLSGETGVECGENAFVIHTKAGTHDVSLYVTFPSTGGFRVRLSDSSEKSGYFQMDAEKIKYGSGANGAITVRSSDGSYMRYQGNSESFSIMLFSAKSDKLVALGNEQISLAYKNGKDTIIKTMVEFPLVKNEAVYNGAERYSGVNLVGTEVCLYNVDAAYHGSSSDIVEERPYSYINSPFFHSNRGYSVWFNMNYGGTADIGKKSSDKYSVMFEGGDKLDFVMWAGTPKENIKKYTTITGTSIVPEKWVFRYWMGGAYYPWNQGNGYQNLKDCIEGYKKIGIKNIAAYFCEGLFANAQCNQLLRSEQSRMLMWYGANAYTKDQVQDWLPLTDYLDLPFAHNIKAENQLSTSNAIDYSNPNIVECLKTQLGQYWKWGVQGAMKDFGEYIPYDTVCYNGLTGAEMHNLMSVYYGKAASEAWSSYWGNDYILFQRSGFSGSQKYTANFLGDQTVTWRGLRDQLYATISMGMGGFNIYGGDMGGFNGNTENETYVRWYQFAAFEPLMRTHGATELHLPWEKGAVASKNFTQFYWLRENILDAVYSAAVNANKTAEPMVQGMAVAYPYQLSLASVEDEYLFCNNFLVCPITEKGAFTRSVLLPRGKWYSLWDYSVVEGGQTITAEAPTTFIPVYLRSGTVSPITLPASLELTESMQDVETFSGLLITPPEAKRTQTVYDSTDRNTVYTCENINESSFSVTADSASDRGIVLAYGVTAAGASVDGNSLKRLSAKPDVTSEEYGYYVDYSGRTFLYLPQGWKKLEISKGESKYKSLKMTCTDTVAESALSDGDLTTVCEFSGKREEIVLKLSGEQTVGRIDVRWTNRYASSYKLEYSADGNTWQTLKTVENAIGGINIIDFEPVKASYLRLSSVVGGEISGNPAIYALSAYAPDDFSSEYLLSDDDLWNDYTNDEDYTDLNLDEDSGESSYTIRKKVPGTKISKIIYETPVWLYILIGVAVLVAIFLFVFFIIRKRRKSISAKSEPFVENE